MSVKDQCPHGDYGRCKRCEKERDALRCEPRDGVNVIRGRDLRSEEQGDKISMFNAEY